MDYGTLGIDLCNYSVLSQNIRTYQLVNVCVVSQTYVGHFCFQVLARDHLCQSIPKTFYSILETQSMFVPCQYTVGPIITELTWARKRVHTAKVSKNGHVSIDSTYHLSSIC